MDSLLSFMVRLLHAKTNLEAMDKDFGNEGKFLFYPFRQELKRLPLSYIVDVFVAFEAKCVTTWKCQFSISDTFVSFRTKE